MSPILQKSRDKLYKIFKKFNKKTFGCKMFLTSSGNLETKQKYQQCFADLGWFL